MIDTSQIRLGQLVTSIAGRDKGRKLIVIDIVDDLHVVVADGDLRRLAKRKIKKMRHLNVSKQVFNEVAEIIESHGKLTDEKLRKLLEMVLNQVSDGGA
ncbi:MAG: RNA-binding protein [Clostridiales bacterium]|nr:MAG: RNA-binding protein [Clostridiales bacterium]